MTTETILLNVFFSYFFVLEEYLPVLFAYFILGSIVVSYLNFLLGVDRYRP